MVQRINSSLVFLVLWPLLTAGGGGDGEGSGDHGTACAIALIAVVIVFLLFIALGAITQRRDERFMKRVDDQIAAGQRPTSEEYDKYSDLKKMYGQSARPYPLPPEDPPAA